jgi:hypothetical protein
MKKLTVLLICLFLFIGLSNAQDKNSKQPLFKVTSFSTSIGFAGAITSDSDDDYYSLKNASSDPDIFVDIDGMENQSSQWSYGNDFDYNMDYHSGSGNGSFLVNLGLTPYSKKLGQFNDKRELRFSLGGNFGTRNTFTYYDNNAFVIDTFQSATTGEIIYADSSIRKYYHYTLEFSEINFGVSYLFKTDVKRTFHFYAGIGANYGIALKSEVLLDENAYRSVYYYNQYNKPSDDEYTTYDDQVEMTSTSLSTNLEGTMHFVRAFIPIGVSLRLSKKPTSFFNDVNLYSEWNPGIELQILSGEKTYANPYVGMAFIGVRYRW